jgi:hypothetical protein
MSEIASNEMRLGGKKKEHTVVVREGSAFSKKCV